jgi:hypothetical protein
VDLNSRFYSYILVDSNFDRTVGINRDNHLYRYTSSAATIIPVGEGIRINQANPLENDKKIHHLQSMDIKGIVR